MTSNLGVVDLFVFKSDSFESYEVISEIMCKNENNTWSHSWVSENNLQNHQIKFELPIQYSQELCVMIKIFQKNVSLDIKVSSNIFEPQTGTVEHTWSDDYVWREVKLTEFPLDVENNDKFDLTLSKEEGQFIATLKKSKNLLEEALDAITDIPKKLAASASELIQKIKE